MIAGSRGVVGVTNGGGEELGDNIDGSVVELAGIAIG